jgi:hypothetical protein
VQNPVWENVTGVLVTPSVNHHKIDCYVRGLDFYDRYLARS